MRNLSNLYVIFEKTIYRILKQNNLQKNKKLFAVKPKIFYILIGELIYDLGKY